MPVACVSHPERDPAPNVPSFVHKPVRTFAGKLRVLLADDHAVVREGLKLLINAQANMEVVDEASDGRVAVQKALHLQPDVVVMDISMPFVSGTGATRQIKQSVPYTKILALSVHEDRSYLREMLDAGAAGYVLKRSAADDLIRAIHLVAGGGVYLDPTFVQQAGRGLSITSQQGSIQGSILKANGFGELSERETDILRRIAQGYSNKEIAAQLDVSVKTVETHKARGAKKTGLESRVDIMRYAMQQGWLGEIGNTA